MKAALNGALNVSIRDGWWDEWFDGNNGWAIPTADGITDPERRDDLEAAALYDLIEENVTARFYEKGPAGLPNRWIEMVRHTLDSLGPKVLASRMVRDYATQLYEPAAIASRAAAADDFALAKDLAHWKHRVRAGWWRVTVEHVEAADVGDDPQLGSRVAVHAMVTLGDLEPDDVAVQLIFGRVDIDDRLVKTDKVRLTPEEQDGDGRWKFVGEVSLDRTGPFGYTVRAVPFHVGLASDAEMGIQAQPISAQDQY
jgi:starch phosphorylase